MSENRYKLAGWLAITGAIVFPLAFGLSIIQGLIGAAVFKYKGPNLGPSDLLMVLFTAIGVYLLIMFRRLLHEIYEFRELDVLITIAIVWNIFMQVTSLFVSVVIMTLWPISEAAWVIVQISFFVFFMVTMGIIDIIFAVKLFKLIDMANNLIKALAWLTMIAGVLEVTVILAVLALPLVPVSFIIYGLIFLRAKEEVEFV